MHHFQFRHSNGAGSSHQYAVGCADADADVGKDNEERSSLWQITNDAEIEVPKSVSTDTSVTVDRWSLVKLSFSFRTFTILILQWLSNRTPAST